jgi:hypothetical protein
MISIKKTGSHEDRHFMDGEHQITVGIDPTLWLVVQQIADTAAGEKGSLVGNGSDWDRLNVWIVGQVHRCPKDIELWAWIEKQALEHKDRCLKQLCETILELFPTTPGSMAGGEADDDFDLEQFVDEIMREVDESARGTNNN